MTVEGSRYAGGGLGDFGAWKCPGCGSDQTGAFELGCVACGAGKPGVAGVPPAAPHHAPAPPRAAPPIAAQPAVEPRVTVRPPVTPGLPFEAWWLEYVAQFPIVRSVEVHMANAFFAGMKAGIAEGLRAARQPVIADPREPPHVIDQLGTFDAKQSRTLAAALAQFIEQTLVDGPEEVAQGEWCSADEARALLRQLLAIDETAGVLIGDK